MKQKNYMLVIAIDKYRDNLFPTLNNAKLDAERFVKVMKEKYGFKLVQEPLFDNEASRKNIVEAINHLSSFLTEGDNIVIYFAGHGAIHSKTKKGYWIPSDASQSVSDYIPNSTVIDSIEGIEAKHILLISDSCFAGTFLTQSRTSDTNHYKKLAEHKSRWLIASGREELVSDGQPGVGSPFAISLNNYFEKNIANMFSLTELSVEVAKEVGSISKQQPIFAHIEGVGHAGGQMIFEIAVDLVTNTPDVNPDLKRIVVPFDTAIELQRIGIPQKSIFGYYTSNKKTIIKKFDGANDFVCSAFISDEIMEWIPEEIEVTENTYLARATGYDKIAKSQLKYAYAEVTFQRTGITDTAYMSICRCKGRMVAFSMTTDNTYNNLICWGQSQVEVAALMLIRLYQEGKISFKKEQQPVT